MRTTPTKTYILYIVVLVVPSICTVFLCKSYWDVRKINFAAIEVEVKNCKLCMCTNIGTP